MHLPRIPSQPTSKHNSNNGGGGGGGTNCSVGKQSEQKRRRMRRSRRILPFHPHIPHHHHPLYWLARWLPPNKRVIITFALLAPTVKQKKNLPGFAYFPRSAHQKRKFTGSLFPSRKNSYPQRVLQYSFCFPSPPDDDDGWCDGVDWVWLFIDNNIHSGGGWRPPSLCMSVCLVWPLT